MATDFKGVKTIEEMSLQEIDEQGQLVEGDETIENPIGDEVDELGGEPEEEVIENGKDGSGEGEDDEEDGDEEYEKKVIAHFGAMKSLGILDLPEDFDFDDSKPHESMVKAYQIHDKQITEKAVTQILESVPEGVKHIVEYGVIGGNNYSEYEAISRDIQLIQTADIENIEVQKDFIRNGLQESLLGEEEIKEHIEALEANNQLKAKAEAYKNKLLNPLVQRQKAMSEEAKSREKERIAKLEEYSNGLATELQRRKFSSDVKRDLTSMLNKNSEKNLLSLLEEVLSDPGRTIDLARYFHQFYDRNKGFKANPSAEDGISQLEFNLKKQGNNRRKKKGSTETKIDFSKVSFD